MFVYSFNQFRRNGSNQLFYLSNHRFHLKDTFFAFICLLAQKESLKRRCLPQLSNQKAKTATAAKNNSRLVL